MKPERKNKTEPVDFIFIALRVRSVGSCVQNILASYKYEFSYPLFFLYLFYYFGLLAFGVGLVDI